MRGTVYLAGPISGLSYEGATDWRNDVCVELAEFGITGLSPMRHKEYLLGETTLADAYDDDPLKALSTSKAITTRDRWDCQRADLVLMNLAGATKVSIGSMIEIGWADAARVPIVGVLGEDDLHYHAMVRECLGWVVPTLEEAVDITIAVLA